MVHKIIRHTFTVINENSYLLGKNRLLSNVCLECLYSWRVADNHSDKESDLPIEEKLERESKLLQHKTKIKNHLWKFWLRQQIVEFSFWH
jgi:hypothetical protein